MKTILPFFIILAITFSAQAFEKDSLPQSQNSQLDVCPLSKDRAADLVREAILKSKLVRSKTISESDLLKDIEPSSLPRGILLNQILNALAGQDCTIDAKSLYYYGLAPAYQHSIADENGRIIQTVVKYTTVGDVVDFVQKKASARK